VLFEGFTVHGQNKSGKSRPQSVDGLLVDSASAVVNKCAAEQSSKREQQHVILSVSLYTEHHYH